MKKSAGTLLYRQGSHGLEVLLVHPSGNYNRKAPWGIPKGEPDDGEDDLETTARRETLEETGIKAEELNSLGYIVYRKSGKHVYAFAGLAPAEAQPVCASWEIDQARFLTLQEARKVIHPDQAEFLDRLLDSFKSQDE